MARRNYEGVEIAAAVPTLGSGWWGDMTDVQEQGTVAECMAEALAEYLAERFPGAEIEVRVPGTDEPDDVPTTVDGEPVRDGMNLASISQVVHDTVSAWLSDTALWEPAARTGRLRHCRVVTGQTQEQFARALGMKANSLARLERRERAMDDTTLFLAERVAADKPRGTGFTISYDVPERDEYWTNDSADFDELPNVIENVRRLIEARLHLAFPGAEICVGRSEHGSDVEVEDDGPSILDAIAEEVRGIAENIDGGDVRLWETDPAEFDAAAFSHSA